MNKCNSYCDDLKNYLLPNESLVTILQTTFDPHAMNVTLPDVGNAYILLIFLVNALKEVIDILLIHLSNPSIMAETDNVLGELSDFVCELVEIVHHLRPQLTPWSIHGGTLCCITGQS